MRGTRTRKVLLGACFLCVLLSLPLVLWGVHGAGNALEERGKGKGKGKGNSNNGDEEFWPSRSLWTGPGVALSAQPAVDEEARGGEGSRQRIASRSPQRGGLDIYWINLDESVGRRASMETMLKSAAASFPTVRSTRVTGIDTEAVRDMLRRGRVKLKEGLAAAPSGAEETWKLNFRNEYTEGQFACALSHLTAIKRAYDDNSELALILEDDVSVPASFLETWEWYAAMAPPDWTILQWYTNNPVVANASFHYQDPWISWMPGHWGTQAYMVNRDGMERILRGVQGDASAHWYFGDDIVIADELLYALGGKAYTATRTLGIQHDYAVASVVQSKNPGTTANSKKMALLQVSNVSMARITPRKECILVLTNLLMETEEQLNDNIATLGSDMRALSQWNPCSKWKVNFVVRTNLETAFAEKLRGLMERGDLEPMVRYTSSSARFNKYAFMKPLVRQMGEYDYVLMKDADQRIAGFPWNAFMEKKGGSVISGPLREAVGESLMNWMRRKAPGRQWYQLHEARYWKSAANATDFESVEPLAAGYIEQYFALLDGDFAARFFELVLTDEFLDQTLDWGPDLMWCGAAADMRPEKPDCSLVPVVSEHLDTRTIDIERTNCPCTTCPCKAADLPKRRPRGLSNDKAAFLHNVYHDGPLFERWILASEEYRNEVARYRFGYSRTKLEKAFGVVVSLVGCALLGLVGFVGIQMFRHRKRMKVLLPQMVSESHVQKKLARTMFAKVILDVRDKPQKDDGFGSSGVKCLC
ncbi:hypothetical protein HOP50_06g46330 [Chloropicon primus]|uniref:Glycosyl transferase family 25 domain-containing protein n=1 Tax=Chloropicon primus TaxID=1764295 RepID=A0A5B8MNK3_9CHLO|nr:hypothetical protein A3770_06p46110 [Chloropicon primus]UPR01311.1 hypothetical protein HOP50_06g46330 [Chloropicon primus]|eukprot:QDZ22093.1 hypothetical protein A3770_06p46110 [Chloropicon primus]